MTESQAVPVRTVTGVIGSDELGVTLTHEHLANVWMQADGGVERDPLFPELLEQKVSASNAWMLRDRPYSNYDNCVLDDDEGMLEELLAYKAVGGVSVMETTPDGEGRSPERLRAMSEASGINVVMGGGWYLERFHPKGFAGLSVDGITNELMQQYRPETAEAGILPGFIGEIGISPFFTEQEAKVLRAAGNVQLDQKIPIMVHLPGWKRYGEEVARILIKEVGVDPHAIVLAHMDPSGVDSDYQRRLAERGVWIEFDMIGMPFYYPSGVEGQSPSPADTATAIKNLVDAGHGDQVLLSHDLFLKAMMTKHGGNGLCYVPTLFVDRLEREGVDPALAQRMLRHAGRLFEAAAR
ncbi:MAG TPA: phosphotriesterase-related protein [Gryllotalpicola sp.]